MGSLTRELMMNLDPGEGDIVLVDLEAGIESFGRGMEQGADTVLVVTEPSLDSVLLSAKIRYMAEGLGIQRIRAILNKTRDPRTERRIRDMLIEHEVRYIGTMPHGEDVADASLEGTVPLEGASVENVRWLTGLLLDEAEMDHPITLHAVLEA
jgi:CO dehydrogenase maturation factor